LRYGDDFAGRTQAIAYGEELRLGDVKIKFIPPAMCWVRRKSRCPAKTPHRRLRRLQGRARPHCAPFEAVPCDVFITEATFGLPVFRHSHAADESKSF